MRRKKFLVVIPIIAAICASPSGLIAEDVAREVVVTATRLETPTDEISGTILVITAEEIEEKQAKTVAEVLRGEPGIDLVNQGGPGKVTSVLLRGGDTRFTLVLVDGVEVNDPITPERTFDFAHLSTDDVERIEVLFGPQSTLYGSDAIGGVIHIITKKGTREPVVKVEAEVGSFGTSREQAAIRGTSGKVSYSLSASHLETEGISNAAEADGNNETDGYENTTVAGNLGVDLGAGATLRFNVRSVDARNELDHTGGPGGDDPNFEGDLQHLIISGQASFYLTEIWETTLAVSTNSHDRNDINEPDTVRPFTMELSFAGESTRMEFLNNFYLSDNSTFILGVDTETEKGNSRFFSDEFGPYTSTLDEESATIDGFFVQEQYRFSSGLTVTLGTRSDNHSRFGDKTTWRAGISSPLSSSIRFRAVYGTGFRAPSIDQLFNPDYGNPDLDPESSQGWDVGLETTIGRKIRASLSYYLTEFDNLIAWFDADGDPNTWWDGSYENISRAETEGLDVVMDATLAAFRLGVSASYLRAVDDQGVSLRRRPETRWKSNLIWNLSDRSSLNLNAVWVGERTDWGDVTLDSYALVNLAGACQVSEKVELFGRINNLLDEEYEEAGGYGTPGISAYVGVKTEL